MAPEVSFSLNDAFSVHTWTEALNLIENSFESLEIDEDSGDALYFNSEAYYDLIDQRKFISWSYMYQHFYHAPDQILLACYYSHLFTMWMGGINHFDWIYYYTYKDVNNEHDAQYFYLYEEGMRFALLFNVSILEVLDIDNNSIPSNIDYIDVPIVQQKIEQHFKWIKDFDLGLYNYLTVLLCYYKQHQNKNSDFIHFEYNFEGCFSDDVNQMYQEIYSESLNDSINVIDPDRSLLYTDFSYINSFWILNSQFLKYASSLVNSCL